MRPHRLITAGTSQGLGRVLSAMRAVVLATNQSVTPIPILAAVIL